MQLIITTVTVVESDPKEWRKEYPVEYDKWRQANPQGTESEWLWDCYVAASGDGFDVVSEDTREWEEM